ncbi:hypothetical protein [Solibacillus sp. FSL K6-1523]|uniref:hypothetical protein n=1 Tax=Solibacillus sp. FSL K6-1523 TaxID=2921471 RepID=UPI0030F94AA7
MDIGNRIYYQKSSGTVIYQAGEMSDAPNERPIIDEIAYIDVPFGSIDYAKDWIVGVDLESGQPIVVTFKDETAEEKRIRELEDELLLQAENEIGGIL